MTNSSSKHLHALSTREVIGWRIPEGASPVDNPGTEHPAHAKITDPDNSKVTGNTYKG
jgi:hypothetical protein